MVLNDLQPNMATGHPLVETSNFEQLYLAVREREARVYTDEEVARLPQIPPEHIYAREWETRRRSAKRLVAHLQKKRRPLKILEVGCGNGWLSSEMGYIPQSKVIGIDVNQAEIEQAQRVFKAPNLKFIVGGFDNVSFINERFDAIIFAAVLPYFESVGDTISTALNLLRDDGEVHIVDTHFYNVQTAAFAMIRCREYYEAMGLPEMKDHYYHHKLTELDGLHYRVLIDPRNVMNRLFKKDPFYWIVVKPEV